MGCIIRSYGLYYTTRRYEIWNNYLNWQLSRTKVEPFLCSVPLSATKKSFKLVIIDLIYVACLCKPVKASLKAKQALVPSVRNSWIITKCIVLRESLFAKPTKLHALKGKHVLKHPSSTKERLINLTERPTKDACWSEHVHDFSLCQPQQCTTERD